MKKLTPFIVGVAVLAVAAVVWFFVVNKPAGNAPLSGEALPPGTGSAEVPVDNTQTGLGGQVFGQVSANPVQGNIPESNPFTADAVANPYSDSYTNPFSQ